MFKTRLRKITAIVTAIVVLIVALCAGALVWYSHEQNKTIIVTPYTVSHPQIPAAFEGKRIVLLTDLHNRDFGGQLTQKVRDQQPDIIVIAGDWISYGSEDITAAKREINALVGIAPIYFVPGNHEAIAPKWQELRTYIESIGVVVLENEVFEWTVSREHVQLVGVFDPEFSTHLRRDFAPIVRQDEYTVLLYHRPERFEEAAAYDADLLLCGHAHGGQVRLPLVGAIYAPNQTVPPKYDVGHYMHGNASMILSQGLGEHVGMRILTPPEIVVITLDSPHK